jgi:hypothetical protein
MEPDIDKLTKKLSNLNVEPNEVLFDNIYNRFNKKRKQRMLLWWFSILSGIGFIFVMLYFISVANIKENKTVKTTMENKSLDQKRSNKVKEDNCPTNNYEIQKNPTKKKHHKAKTSGTIITKESKFDKITEQHNILDDKNLDHRFETDREHDNDLYDQIMDSQLNRTIDHFSSKKLEFDTVSNQDSLNIDHILEPLTNKTIYLEIKRSFSYPKITDEKNTPLFVPILPTYMIDFYANTGSQQFCSYANAKKISYGFGLNYKIYKNMYVRLGLSQSKINYSFDFNNELFNRFGQTDKFPALPLINHRVEKISSGIGYTSLDIGFTANLWNHRKHQILASVRQEIICSSNQEINFNLTENGQYLYLTSNRKIRAHQLISSVIYQYKITGNVGLGIQVSHNYSLDYLGIEREWYSGFNIGSNITYGF